MVRDWDESEHPRDDEGKFTYKNGGVVLKTDNISKSNSSNIIDRLHYGDLTAKKLFEEAEQFRLRAEKTYKPNYISQDLKNIIDDIKNTVVEIKDVGRRTLGDIIPNLENYVEDNRTEEDKLLDLFYPTMKEEHPFKTDCKLFAKGAVAFINEFNKRIETQGIKHISFDDFVHSRGWNNFITTAIKSTIYLNNYLHYVQTATGMVFNPTKVIENIDNDQLTDMINDYLDGGIMSQTVLKNVIGHNTANLLRLSGKDNDPNIAYTIFADKYNSPDDLPDNLKKYTPMIKEILKKQNLNENSKGFYFGKNSSLAKDIAKSVELKTFLLNHLNELINFDKINETMDFSKNDLYYSIGKAYVMNIQLNYFNNHIIGDLIDTTDYNNDDPRNVVRAARRLQEEGKIEPKFIIVHFSVPLKDIINLKQQW